MTSCKEGTSQENDHTSPGDRMLSVRLPYGDILHSLTYAGIRRSTLAHRFEFVFSSSQYVGIRCCSHTTSKIFVHAQNFRRMPTNE